MISITVRGIDSGLIVDMMVMVQVTVRLAIDVMGGLCEKPHGEVPVLLLLILGLAPCQTGATLLAMGG